MVLRELNRKNQSVLCNANPYTHAVVGFVRELAVFVVVGFCLTCGGTYPATVVLVTLAYLILCVRHRGL